MMKARRSAFTLIEALVVVVIIGVLAMIMAPDYLRYRQQIDLKNSVSLIQTGFQEAYSLSRSRSRHFLITVNQNDDFYSIKECDDFSDDDGYNCTTFIDVLNASGGIINPLEGNTQITSNDFEVHFYAPHGDMNIVAPSGMNPLVINLDNNGLTDEVYVFQESGLVTTDAP